MYSGLVTFALGSLEQGSTVASTTDAKYIGHDLCKFFTAGESSTHFSYVSSYLTSGCLLVWV